MEKERDRGAEKESELIYSLGAMFWFYIHTYMRKCYFLSCFLLIFVGPVSFSGFSPSSPGISNSISQGLADIRWTDKVKQDYKKKTKIIPHFTELATFSFNCIICKKKKI